MGSGALAAEGLGKAASISRIALYDENDRVSAVDLLLGVSRGQDWCTVAGSNPDQQGTTIYFGGPGGTI